MRTCETYEAWLSALLDGELDPKYQAELMEHLSDCPACRQYFDDLMAIQDALAEPDGVKAPEGFAQSVMDAVAKTPQGGAEPAPRNKKPALRWRRWAALAACLALVAAAGLWAESRMWRCGSDMSDSMVNYAIAPRSGEAATGEGVYGNGAMKEQSEPDTPETMDGCAPMEADRTEEPAAKGPAAQQTAGTLVAGGDAVRAWVEEQGWTWEPGAEYQLTAEQYEQLLALLEGETYELSIEEGGGVCRLVIPSEP